MIHSAVTRKGIGVFVFGGEGGATIVIKRIYTCTCKKRTRTRIRLRSKVNVLELLNAEVHLRLSRSSPAMKTNRKKYNIHVDDIVWQDGRRGFGCLSWCEFCRASKNQSWSEKEDGRIFVKQLCY